MAHLHASITYPLRIIGISLVVFSVLSMTSFPSHALADDDRWNWSAFLFTPVWALFTRVYVGLFAIIPGVGFVIAVYMGIFGRRMALERSPARQPSSPAVE